MRCALNMISPCEKAHFSEMFSVTDAIEKQLYEKNKNKKVKADFSMHLYSGRLLVNGFSSLYENLHIHLPLLPVLPQEARSGSTGTLNKTWIYRCVQKWICKCIHKWIYRCVHKWICKEPFINLN